MSEETCEICKWTNSGCQNLGEPENPKWVCHGCSKRAFDVLVNLHEFLWSNVGDSADWPIRITVDDDECQEKLCDLLNDARKAIGLTSQPKS